MRLSRDALRDHDHAQLDWLASFLRSYQVAAHADHGQKSEPAKGRSNRVDKGPLQKSASNRPRVTAQAGPRKTTGLPHGSRPRS